MSDGPAASVGVVFAGLALAAAFLPWTGAPMAVGGVGVGSPGGAAIAGVALFAFLLRRHGVLDRRAGATLAGASSLAILGYALYSLVASGIETGSPSVGIGLPIAASAGALGIAAAVADRAALPAGRLRRMVGDVLMGAAVGVAGLAVGTAVALAGMVLVGGRDTVVTTGAATVGFGVGLALVAGGVLRFRGYGTGYVDIELPDRWDLLYAVGGTLALLGLGVAISVAFQQLGLPSARSTIEQQARETDPTFLLVLVPMSWLVIGPGEELVFRNVVQKSLYENFSPAGAVVVTSAIFALVHVPQYYSPNPVATLNTLAVVFVLSLILGAAYARTRNLLVPILIHGTFNAIQFAGLYVSLTRDTALAFVA